MVVAAAPFRLAPGVRLLALRMMVAIVWRGHDKAFADSRASAGKRGRRCEQQNRGGGNQTFHRAFPNRSRALYHAATISKTVRTSNEIPQCGPPCAVCQVTQFL